MSTAVVETYDAIDADPYQWPEPPDDRAYHGIAGEIVRTIVTEADPVAIMASFLDGVGNLIGRKGVSFGVGAQATLPTFTARNLVGTSSKGPEGHVLGAGL